MGTLGRRRCLHRRAPRPRVAWPPVTVLTPLLDLPDVADALHGARRAVDSALGDRSLRRTGGRVAAEASLRAARASAALEGVEQSLEDIRAGTVTDPLIQGCLRVAEALPGMVDTWPRAPGQVLARLHVLAARGLVPDEGLGRPVADVSASPRFAGLLELITAGDPGPGLLHAAVVHAELLALKPFEGPGGVVARAAGRLTLLARGVDPRGLIVVDAGHLERHPEYLGAANAYATGTTDGVRSWLRHYAAAVTVGAEQTAALSAELTH